MLFYVRAVRVGVANGGIFTSVILPLIWCGTALQPGGSQGFNTRVLGHESCINLMNTAPAFI